MPAQPPDREHWRRIEEVCEAALKLPPAERAAYVADACRGDAALRREVEALLAHEQMAERFLDAAPGAVAASVLPDVRADLVGATLGDYEITARLGEGGMGEVYRARDRKLGRDVAIKVLPDAFAAEPERLKRFEREARLLATVNHPNIGAIYGLLEAGGMRGLVLELVDGQTLAATLERGPLPPSRALSIATQIADALEHAHRRGITHRDLKPSNVMLTAAGVKLLDFGVGKWTPGPGQELVIGASTLTGEGRIVGTLHYMAPEQLEGKDADARSDLFAFGAVLYEMLTAKKAFDGPSQASIIAAVIEAPAPRLSGVGGAQAPRLERVVNKCLAKNPDERWQTARDLGDELRWLAGDFTQPAHAVTAAEDRGRFPWLLAGAAALGVLALGIASWDVWLRARMAPAGPGLIQFEVRTPLGAVPYAGFDVSNDGTQLVYSNSTTTNARGGDRGLYVRRLDRPDAYLIRDTDGGGMPRFSPDGQWIIYFALGTLRKVRANGEGPTQPVTEYIGSINGLSWQRPGTILIASADRGLRRVSANGGTPVEFTSPNREAEVDHHTPSPLPDGTHMLLGVHRPNNRFSVAVQPIDGNERLIVIESGFSPVYSPTGHLVFGRGNTIYAAPFDLARRRVTGPETALVERVYADPASGDIWFRLSPSGVLAYIPEPPRTGRTLTWVGADGRLAPVGADAGAVNTPRLSPNGRQLVYVVEEDSGLRQIWTYDILAARRMQLTRGGDHWSPLWTNDGLAVIYAQGTPTGSDVILHPLDGGDTVRLGGNTNLLFPGALSVDGRALLLTEAPPTGEYFLSQLRLGHPGVPSRLQVAGRRTRTPSLSPDGRWMAFAALEPGRLQIFVQAYPPTGMPRQISIEGGREPLWSRDGRMLFYRWGDQMFAVTIDTSRGLTWTAAKPIFEADVVSNFRDYDVAPDGRFVMIAADPREREPPHINIIVNWASELLTRVPVRR